MNERRVVRTVKDMRDFLNDLEKTWTDEDRKFLG